VGGTAVGGIGVGGTGVGGTAVGGTVGGRVVGTGVGGTGVGGTAVGGTVGGLVAVGCGGTWVGKGTGVAVGVGAQATMILNNNIAASTRIIFLNMLRFSFRNVVKLSGRYDQNFWMTPPPKKQKATHKRAALRHGKQNPRRTLYSRTAPNSNEKNFLLSK
jgi:hypothetical protein